jgi:hypothetical protein
VLYTPENRHDNLYRRVTDAHRELVADGKHRFAPGGTVRGHHDGVAFTVDMIVTGPGETAWRGAIFLLLDEEGRVRLNYQYTVS